jgi:hypothetical protein
MSSTPKFEDLVMHVAYNRWRQCSNLRAIATTSSCVSVAGKRSKIVVSHVVIFAEKVNA